MRLLSFCVRFGILLSLSQFSFQVHSANTSVNTKALNSIPEDFQFHGKPISALCIAEIVNNDSGKTAKANLKHCTKKESNYKLSPYQETIEKGFQGFEYTVKNSKEEYVPTESAYYQYLGKFNHLHVIYFIYSGGGSGFFSSVFLVERKNDTLKFIKNIVGVGDRCNGGINSVSFKNDQLTYSINITPYDYIDLSGLKIPNVKAYDDLAACAACCQGTAQFESNLEKTNFVSINLGEESENGQGTYQPCFNALLKEYKQQGKQVLKVGELKEFVEKFQAKCLKP